MTQRAIVMAWLCLAGLLTPLLTRALADSNGMLAWIIDLSSHWQWLFLAGLLLFTSLSAWHRKQWAYLLLAAPLPWLTASAPAPSAIAGSPVLNVFAANVGLHNDDPQPLLDWMETLGADIAVLAEVSPAYATALKSKSQFAYSRVVASSGPFGLAMLSRYPLVDVEILRDIDDIPRIHATLIWQDHDVTVTAIHPMPPLSAHYNHARNATLRTAAQEASSRQAPGLLLGDFNASPWSSAMRGLREARYYRATGLRPTWPAALGGIVGVPIDQVLVTDHWAVNAAGTGPVLDSDHIPVWASISLGAREGAD